MAKKSKVNCEPYQQGCTQSTLEQKLVCQIIQGIKDSCIVSNPDLYSGVIIDGSVYPALMHCDGRMMYFSEDGLLPVPCDSEFTNIQVKDFRVMDGCFMTPTGRVYIEGTEAINSEVVVIHGSYTVKESLDPDFPVNKTFTRIPDIWVMIECLCNC